MLSFSITVTTLPTSVTMLFSITKSANWTAIRVYFLATSRNEMAAGTSTIGLIENMITPEILNKQLFATTIFFGDRNRWKGP